MHWTSNMLAYTDVSGLKRDLRNNALLSTDVKALQAYRDDLKKKREHHVKMEEINELRENVNELMTMRDEIKELKQLLVEHIQRDKQWQ